MARQKAKTVKVKIRKLMQRLMSIIFNSVIFINVFSFFTMASFI